MKILRWIAKNEFYECIKDESDKMNKLEQSFKLVCEKIKYDFCLMFTIKSNILLYVSLSVGSGRDKEKWNLWL